VGKKTLISRFRFRIDNPENKLDEEVNSGGEFNERTKQLITNARSGNTIILENIVIIEGGSTMKLPVKIYHVTD
jgi:hypothetical protein